MSRCPPVSATSRRCSAGCGRAAPASPRRSRIFRWCASPSTRIRTSRVRPSVTATRSPSFRRSPEADAMIRVQREDFDIGAEIAALTQGNHQIGGVASFVGLVRDMAGGGAIGAMTLEHYPGMTEKKLAEIEAEARRRWTLDASLIIHRYGRREAGDRIVLGVTASAHRQAAPAGRRYP